MDSDTIIKGETRQGEEGYKEIDPHYAIERVYRGRTVGEMTADERRGVSDAMHRTGARYDEQHPIAER